MLSLLALLLLGQGTDAPTLPAGPGAADSASAKKPAVSSDTTSVPAESIEVIYYGGNRVIYNADESRVYLMDSAWVRYADMKLDADSIIYDVNRHRLSSYRHSIFRTARDSVVGAELHYDVETRKGYMTMAFTQFGQGFFRGKDIWLVRDKTLDVDNGAYTTCDRPHPHYQFWGRQVRVYLEDMVVVEPIILKIGPVPVLAAPFWFFPISEKRKSGFIPFKVGQDATEGFYAKNVAWYWAINDYADATFTLDVMSKKGFKPSFEGVYAIGPFASGNLAGTYMTEADTKRRRYTINARHRSKFLFGSRLDASADFQSDTSFVADYSETEVQWLKKELDSYATISRDFKRIGAVSLYARRHTDLQSHRTDTDFPRLSATFVSLPLFRDWNLSSGISAANSQTDITDSLGSTTSTSRSVSPSFTLTLPGSIGLSLPLSGGYSETRTVRHLASGAGRYASSVLADSLLSQSRQANAGTGFGFNHNLFGFLNLSEGFNYSQTVQFSESTYAQAGYGARASSSFSLYRIFGLEVFGLHGLLHKATPGISYSYTPRTQSRGWFGTPRFDTLPASSGMTFNLANDFQVKVGEDQQKLDLGNLGISSAYDFTTGKFSPVNANLDFSLSDFMFRRETQDTLTDSLNPTRSRRGRQQAGSLIISGGTAFDPDKGEFTGYNVDTRFAWDIAFNDTAGNPGQKYRLALEHNLSKDGHMLKAQLGFQPKGWRMALTGGWNIKQQSITDYNLEIARDLHCWELVGNVSRLGSRWAYDFKVRIKAIPEVSVGRGLFGSLLP
jgi:hypothetical protein